MYLCALDIFWFYRSIASMNERTLPRKLKIKGGGTRVLVPRHQNSGAPNVPDWYQIRGRRETDFWDVYTISAQTVGNCLIIFIFMLIYDVDSNLKFQIGICRTPVASHWWLTTNGFESCSSTVAANTAVAQLLQILQATGCWNYDSSLGKWGFWMLHNF